MSVISRVSSWFSSPSSAGEVSSKIARLREQIEYVNDNCVVIHKAQWDGFPERAEDCRRAYSFGDGLKEVHFANVKCSVCGDQIMLHDNESVGTEGTKYELREAMSEASDDA